MRTFFFIPGAFHGSIHFNAVMALLAARGHRCHAIDLPGNGIRALTPLSYKDQDWRSFEDEPSPLRDLTLDDYRDAAAREAVAVAGEGRITVVAHSQGGLTANLLGNAIPEKIERLVYLTAHVPLAQASMGELLSLPEAEGQMPGNLLIGDPGLTGCFRINPASPDAGYRARLKYAFYDDVAPDVYEGYAHHLTPDTPLKVCIGDARAEATRWGGVPKTYIRCTEDWALPLPLQDRMIREANGGGIAEPFDVLDLKSSHSPFASMPGRLADLLAR